MEQIIEIGDYKIFTKTEGEGAPVLLLHSYWGSHLLFDQLASRLSKSRQVIRIDLPGHGGSGDPPEGYRFDAFAEVLDELLLRLHIIEKTIIIGHSMGGYIALSYIARYPQKTESLVLIHSPVKSADIQSVKLRNREAGLLLKGKRELLLQVTIPSNFAPGDNRKSDVLLALLNYTAGQVTTNGALRSIEAMNHRSDYLKTLQGAHYPILIIAGKYDKVYAAEEQLKDGGTIAKAEVLLLNHSGHLGFLEEEELVLNKLNQFINHR